MLRGVFAGLVILGMLFATSDAQAQDAPIPVRKNLAKPIINPDTANKIADRIDQELLAIFPPDGFSGVRFLGRSVVIPSGDRYAITLPSMTITKPGLGIRFDVGTITLTAKLLVDPELEKFWRYDVSIRLPSTIYVRDPANNAELSRILIGHHDIQGTWEGEKTYFSQLRMEMDHLYWQRDTLPDPTDPDFSKPGYSPKPQVYARLNDLHTNITMGVNDTGRLSGPVKINTGKIEINYITKGLGKMLVADSAEWYADIRKVDFSHYNPFLQSLDQILNTGINKYPDQGPKIDEEKRNSFFDGMTTQVKSVQPILDGVDNVLTLTRPELTLLNDLGTVTAKSVTLGTIVNSLMDSKSQIGARLITTDMKLTPKMPTPDLFPRDMDLRISISKIPNRDLWKVITDIPGDMKIYNEKPALDYAWNKFFYTLAKFRAQIQIDKSYIRSHDLDAEFVFRGSFLPAAKYLMTGGANANLIGMDELAQRTVRASNTLKIDSIMAQAKRKQLYNMGKVFGSIRDAGNRGVQREKGMTRRYNVEIDPKGAIKFNGIDIMPLFHPE